MPPESRVLTDSLLPVPLSRVVAQLATSGLHLDLAIDGVPFSLKMTQDNPLLRQMVEDKKDQFDTSGQQGEQSFGYWWLRSQASLHGGAGQEFLDTGTVDPQLSRIKYNTSTGVYPFDPGKVTVPASYNYGSAQGGKVYAAAVPVTRGGNKRIALMRTDSANVDFFNLSTFAYTTVSLTTGTPQAMCTDGNRVFVAVGDAIKRINEDDSITTIATLTFASPISLGFAKQRVILGHGRDLYEVDPNGSAVALGATQRRASHANADWRWNVIADGPTGIYAAGYSGPISSVFSLSEVDSSGTLVLGPATEQATMPTGERVLSMMFYVNSVFVLGTTAGARVGKFSFYAQPQWGPASIPGVSITSLTAVGSVIHATSADNKVYWLDLGTPSDQAGRFAYALRTTAPEALVAAVAANDPAQVYLVTNNRVGREDATLTRQATLTSSWMTFNTVEHKRPHFITISGSWPGPAGTVTVESQEGTTQQFTIPAASTQTVHEFGLSMEPSAAYRVTFTLNQDSGTQNVLRSFQVKALPEARRYQQVIYPVLVEDIETCSNGERVGYDGFAADRINLLEGLARTNAVITVRDRLMGQSYQCRIRDVQYRQEQGPQQSSPLGGIATVIVTMVA